MNDFYCPIPLSFELEVNFSPFMQQQTRLDINTIPPNMHDWVDKNLNAYILWSEVFYLRPFQSYDIHCDGHEIDNKCKLNYIVNGDDSKMYWYKAVDANKIVTLYSKSNTRYLKLEKNNAEEIGQANLVNFNLVNVGNFHTVKNGKNSRWCLSIVISDNISKERLNFDEVKLRLNKI
jgi:hypothetical protein